MLDNTNRNSPFARRRRRAYACILNGCKFALAHHQRLYFLTLTSSPDSASIADSFPKLVKRIRRKYGVFEYVYIRTSEGLGVLHILFKCRFRIDIVWLRQNWVDLHKAPQMKLVSTYGGAKGIVRYLAGYLTDNPIQRLASSSLWIFKSWRKTFCAYISREGFYEGISKFDLFLSRYDTKTLYSKKYSTQLMLDVI